MKSSRTSLASRTDFEVLGLEPSSPRKLPCPRLEDSTIFWIVEIVWKAPETSQKICEDLFCFPPVKIAWKNFWRPFSPKKFFWKPFFWDCLKKIFWKPFFWRTLAPVSLVLGLGLERICPWPWPRIFFVFLTLASSLVSSTPPVMLSMLFFQIRIFRILCFCMEKN